ncbi:MAG TPA: bifunctional adenosylcobinamide kinase/adenosylcobinamide-phosphate guanylyltransferase [Acidobacteriaceae bacterium]|jgi:adenosylcobinamide kinase/adenosylcobinamide-phosphate guanylyltransferase
MSSSGKQITLCLGGVRSGKSRFAQQLAERAGQVCFLATAQRSDDEMRAKIERHQQDRPSHWTTREEPLDLAGELQRADPKNLLLVDCLTVFVSNLLLQDETGAGAASQIDAFCEALLDTQSSVVLVSNEVGSGVVPPYPLGRRYRDILGELNQRVAALADNVVLMVAGLPLMLKGKLEHVA